VAINERKCDLQTAAAHWWMETGIQGKGAAQIFPKVPPSGALT